MNRIEHVNLTVTDPDQTADMLCKIFDWQLRWSGPAKLGGYTVHVGTDTDYVALYTKDGKPQMAGEPGDIRGGLNHVGVVVDDLEIIEERVKKLGLVPINHADYHPGKRFYFLDADAVEYEVVSYQDS
ncbi:MAG: VOC family protein [Gammaproteobacteria bacterium]|nr:VOC family protein [Gammaproteobacteria bacterium]